MGTRRYRLHGLGRGVTMKHLLLLLTGFALGLTGCERIASNPVVEWEDEWEQERTYISLLILETQIEEAPAPDDRNNGLCPDCQGAGVVGDHKVPCTTCGGRPVSALFSVGDRIPRLLVFSANWCPACETQKREVLQRMGPKWQVGSQATDDIQIVDVSSNENLLSAKAYYGLELATLPRTYVWWSKDKYIEYKGLPFKKPSTLSKWFNSQVAAKRLAAASSTLPQQLMAELHRVTGTQLPMSGIDLDISDKVQGIPEILAALAAGKYSPADGVEVTAEGGNLYPTRTTATDQYVRLHFDQRPTVKAKKWLLTLNTTIQWVDVAKDGRTVLVSLKRFPDIKLTL